MIWGTNYGPQDPSPNFIDGVNLRNPRRGAVCGALVVGLLQVELVRNLFTTGTEIASWP